MIAIRELDHLVLRVVDLPRMLAFYTREMARADGTARNATNGNGVYGGGLRPASGTIGS